MDKNKQLLALNEIGQSIWYDNVSQEVLKSGKLASLIGLGVTGLTSNPSIFQKAIGNSDDYDSALLKLSQEGLESEEICEKLMIEDVRQAADLLMEVYKKTDARDGYASLEVSPYLARDTQATIEAARNLWKKLDRPNAMIKVPATTEGMPAIQALLEEGINVNATLIFSVAAYEKVAEAYICALETRAMKGEPLKNIASVASFFVSRVDAICEKTFDALVAEGKVNVEDRAGFLGKVAVDNSLLAYKKYLDKFGGTRFEALTSQGARVQRPLWASTGTKNPDFNPLLYLVDLVGPDTVNTLPPSTLEILLKGAEISDKLTGDGFSPGSVVSFVESKGIDFQALLIELEEKGVKAFADAYTGLLNSISEKVKVLQSEA